ncbi:hypothetical protein LVB77_16510 [Lysobacter sp. 5GHs7-4]|uniref:hypothetical protein n=1 Tax=Lysobacter sp. 5GHs7-4 TaxID=2904253 RepID=UPI001E5AD431|nr:hypothetical protein [Lysobacter sp. 5GHs7-4]UHQ22255.1 hypothetical protein LVB77_16510 [Lysobacter sp. 5GHs7-4]
MDQHDPYRPPAADTAVVATPFAGWRRSCLALVAIQACLYVFNIATGYQLASTGDISVLALLATVGAVAFLTIGAVMLGARSRAAAYVFAAAALCACVVLWLWRTPIAITGVGIAAIAVLVSMRATGARAVVGR